MKLDRAFAHPIRDYSFLVNPKFLSTYLFGPKIPSSGPSVLLVGRSSGSSSLPIVHSSRHLLLLFFLNLYPFVQICRSYRQSLPKRESPLRQPARSSCKKAKFSHNRSTEKGAIGSTSQIVAPSIILPPPSVIDLEAALETASTFDECIEDLPLHAPKGFDKGKEKLMPSLLANEEEVVTLIQLVISDQDIKSLWPNSTDILARSTFFDHRKVKRFSFSPPLSSFF